MTASGASRTIPAFIANASVDETKAALAKAGLPTEFMPIPLTVVVLKINDRLIMMDAGSGVGQWQANATHLPANMAAAGIDYKAIDTIMISHFHPDHVWGLMEKGTNAPVFPNAELVVNADRVQLVDGPEPARQNCPRDASPPASASPRISRNGRTGSWSRTGPKSLPASSSSPRPATRPATRSSSSTRARSSSMVSADTMYVPALLAPHPEWQGSYDQDGPTAIATRRKLIDRVIADNIRISGSHFPFPGTGTFVKDGNAYGFTPVAQSLNRKPQHEK